MDIEVGTGDTGCTLHPRDFAMNKEVPFLFVESALFSSGKKCPRSVVPPKV